MMHSKTRTYVSKPIRCESSFDQYCHTQYLSAWYFLVFHARCYFLKTAFFQNIFKLKFILWLSKALTTPCHAMLFQGFVPLFLHDTWNVNKISFHLMYTKNIAISLKNPRHILYLWHHLSFISIILGKGSKLYCLNRFTVK